MQNSRILIIAMTAVALYGCREVPVVPSDTTLMFEHGVYVLNEGNMGSNKATIDFYDIEEDTLLRDIYPVVNPTVMKELGDVGNDIMLYGNKLYAVINVSGKVEIMDSQCRRQGQVDVPNCRSLCAEGGYVYVSSYAGPVTMDVNYKQRGYVAKIDTTTLQVTDTCLVGFQPNGIVGDGERLYVANSGGYMAPNYDSTVSVIDLASFKEEKRIKVAINLDQIVYDAAHKALFVTSLGDYGAHPAMLYRVSTEDGKVEEMGIAASKICLVEGKLYYIEGSFVAAASYGILDTETLEKTAFVPENASDIRMPYGILMADGDIYITDARDYVTPGVLYRYSADGKLLSRQRTGDIPGHMCLKK